MRIHYLQHVPFEGIAGIGDWAAVRGHDVSGTPVYREGFPHPGEFDMLVVMGGPMNIYQEREYPWLAEEKRFISSAIEGGRLVLGVCLGAQLIADVLGGPVTPGDHVEIGWYPVQLTAAGHDSRVFGHLPGRFETLHWHGDTFAIPGGATHLATSEACRNQAFEYDDGRVLALQFHLEATRASWSALCEGAAEELLGGGEWVSSADEMLAPDAGFDHMRGMLFTMLDAMTLRR